MATLGLIFWCMTMCFCLCILFKLPKFISKHFNNYRFPNYSRNLTNVDNDFINRYAQLIDNHRAIYEKIPKRFIITSPGYLMLFMVLTCVIFAILRSGGEPVVWLSDVIGNRSTESSYLISPLGGQFTLIIGMFLSFAFIVPAIQFWAVRANIEQLTSFLIVPYTNSKTTPKVLKKGTSDALEILVRKRVLDSHRNYTIDEFIAIGVTQEQKSHIKMVLASTVLFFSVYIMSVFEFVKVSNNQIIYSPPYSFKVTVKNLDDVTNTKFVCESYRGERRLKLLVGLDNGYQFKVVRFLAPAMDAILDTSNLALNDDIQDAIEMCKK